MIQARYLGVIIAESDHTVVVEGNHYFPPSDVKMEYLVESETHTVCPWKGRASYKSLRVGDQILQDAAWYYPDPKPEALMVKDRFAFWKGVEVG